MLKAIFVGAALTLVAGPAMAASQPVTSMTAETTKPKKNIDPNRMVCERQETTGTRLGARKVCLTAAQWEEKRREHREQIERSQRNVGIKNEG